MAVVEDCVRRNEPRAFGRCSLLGPTGSFWFGWTFLASGCRHWLRLLRWRDRRRWLVGGGLRLVRLFVGGGLHRHLGSRIVDFIRRVVRQRVAVVFNFLALHGFEVVVD